MAAGGALAGDDADPTGGAEIDVPLTLANRSRAGGGTLRDGTVSDIAITGDRIVATGRDEAAAREVIDANGDLVRRLIAAVQKGWVAYMTDLDVAERANAAIEAANPEMDDASLWFEWDVQRALFIGDREG